MYTAGSPPREARMSSPLGPAKSLGQKAWTKEESLAALRRLSEMLGGTRPTVCDVRGKLGRQAGCASMEAIRRLCGSWETAVEEAGLAGLPTRKSREREIALKSLREYFEHLLRGRSFLFYGEGADMVRKAPAVLPVQTRRQVLAEICKKRGIRVLGLPASKDVGTVVSWLLGYPAEGILPDAEEIAKSLGPDALRLFRRVVETGSLKAAARSEGLSERRAKRILLDASTRAVEQMVWNANGNM